MSHSHQTTHHNKQCHNISGKESCEAVGAWRDALTFALRRSLRCGETVKICRVSSEGDANEALDTLRRELRELQQPGEVNASPGADEPPATELEALAKSLTKLKASGAVPFDRKRTWDVIEERLDSGDAAEPEPRPAADPAADD